MAQRRASAGPEGPHWRPSYLGSNTDEDTTSTRHARSETTLVASESRSLLSEASTKFVSAEQESGVPLKDEQADVNAASRSRLEAYRTEQKKVACRTSRASAFRNFAWLHLPSVTITFGLIVLYVKQQAWTPPYPSAEQLSALQFAAKAHESLILVSLTDILFHRIRYALLESNGVPLGFLASPFYLASPIQYLLSWEFWGAVVRPTTSTSRHFHIATTGSILLLTFIGVAAGPFSAIAMMPRLIWLQVPTLNVPRNETSTYYIHNRTYETVLDPYYGYLANSGPCAQLLDEPPPVTRSSCTNDVLTGLYSDLLNVLSDPPRLPQTKNISFTGNETVYQRGLTTITTSPQDYAIATAPLGFVATILNYENSYSDKSSSAGIKISTLSRKMTPKASQEKWKQPLIGVQCSNSREPISSTSKAARFRFDDESGEPFEYTLTSEAKIKYAWEVWHERNTTVDPVMLDLNDDLPVSAAMLFPESLPLDQETMETKKEITVQLCLVRGRWMSTDIWVAPQTSSVVQTELGVPTEDLPKRLAEASTDGGMIHMTKEWLTGMNDTACFTNPIGEVSCVTQKGATYAQYSNPFYGSIFSFCSYTASKWTSTCLPLTLAIYLTDMVAMPTGLFDTQTDPNPTSKDTLVERIYYKHINLYTPTDSTSIPLAFAVLLLHVWLVVLHFAFTVLSPDAWHSSAWGSVGQVVALALRSRAPEELHNVGGGVGSCETWRMVVGVREVGEGGGEERLEMVTDAPRVESGGCLEEERAAMGLVKAGARYS